MNYKKVLPLAAALILGLVSACMVVKLMHAKPPQAASGPALSRVVTAGRDVTAGELLDQDALSVGQIVTSSAPGTTFSDPAELVGRVVIVPLVRGQAIVESLLAPKGSAAGLQAIIPQGMRAVTIDVNEVSGVAGYVTPGCRVDLLQSVRDDSTSQVIGRCLVQNVEVTAVGTRGATADSQPAHSVTLLVTPRQAQLIELASTNGHARLVLRGSTDHKTDQLSPVTMSDITGIAHEAAEAIAPRPQTGDPFAATTQPVARAADWRVRVVAAGEASLVSVRTSPVAGQSTFTGNDVRPVNGQ
jgi:pilus assembly protein CpaB